jgi:hypothetical protein
MNKLKRIADRSVDNKDTENADRPVHKHNENFVRVTLARYLSGANTTNISKFLQQELHLGPHEAAKAINTRIIASKVSQELGEQLQEKLKDYKVEISLQTVRG